MALIMTAEKNWRDNGSLAAVQSKWMVAKMNSQLMQVTDGDNRIEYVNPDYVIAIVHDK